jgi:hypothetical protein
MPHAAACTADATARVVKVFDMPQISLRKARTDAALAAISEDPAALLPPGEWFVEQRTDVVKVFSDAHGSTHVANLAVVDFLDGLAKREIVFVSWG